MEGRALRLLISLLALAILVFVILKPKTKGPPPVQSGLLPPGADARVEGLRLLQSGAQGELSLTSHDAEWSRESQSFHLNGVDIQFLTGSTSGGAAPVRGHLTGESGDVNTDAKEFTLEGKVAAETFDGYRLETSNVSYHHATREVETAQAVLLEGPGLRVSGRGASVDYVNQKLEVHGRVHAHVIPAIVEKHLPIVPQDKQKAEQSKPDAKEKKKG